ASVNSYKTSNSTESSCLLSETCDQCGKIFHGANRKFLLSRHKITHTGRRPYQCPFCSYCANVSSNLLRHIRCIHG
ncbi:Zinc finger C2H2-type, partial [Trinorchestia longiramus]